MKTFIDQNIENESGFTLLEVVIAMMVLSIGIFSLYSMHVTSITTNHMANNLTEATSWANSQIETLLSRPYDCTPFEQGCHDLDDVNGDGTNQDSDNDGVDDTGVDRNFGLNNATAATADNSRTSANGLYTMMWNVAVDTPLPDMKTIRVIVNRRDNGVLKSVPMTYTKGK